jgi:hypothetical protein
MNKNICVLLFLFLPLFCYSQDEQTLWDMAFEDFLLKNGEQSVIYTTFDYKNMELNYSLKVLFIYKLSQPGGIIIYTNGRTLLNYFNVFYSDEFNTLIWEDIHGGLSAWKEAKDVINIILNSVLHIDVCKNLRGLVLPTDGVIKF